MVIVDNDISIFSNINSTAHDIHKLILVFSLVSAKLCVTALSIILFVFDNGVKARGPFQQVLHIVYLWYRNRS